MSEYQISRTAYYAIFRDFEPKMATVQPNAKSDKGVKIELHEIFEKRYTQTLDLRTTWLLYPDSGFSGRAGFSDLDPSDGGWSLNPMGTVYIRQILDGIAAFAMLQLNLTRAYFREAFRHNSFFSKLQLFNKF